MDHENKVTEFVVPQFGTDPAPFDVAMAMARAGLRIGPLSHGTKHPGSILGSGWPTRTSNDPKQVAAWFAGTSCGVFLHCVGLVAFDVDHPEAVPDWLWPHLELAPMFSTRSGGDPRRGHYVFAEPAGRRIGNSLGTLARGWGEVRGSGGVIVLPGTRHEFAAQDGLYTQVRAGAVPVLPAPIAAQLPDSDEARDGADTATVRAFLEAATASSDAGVDPRGPIGVFVAQRGTGGRHDACVRAACWIAREAAAGAYPARPALSALRREFLGSFTDAERARGRGAGEWDRIVSYAVGQLTRERVGVERRKLDRSGFDIDDDDEDRAGGDGGDGSDEGDDGSWWRPSTRADPSPATNLPAEFWDARPVLKHIATAAAARLLSPDAVLGCALSIVSSYVKPGVRVESGLGRASLNTFSCVIGDSSSGKSEAYDAASDLFLPPGGLSGMPDNAGLPLGSGEGLAEAFYGMKEEATGEEYLSGPRKGQPKTKQVRCKMYDHASAYADEGEALARMMERSGTVIAQTIRSAWKGGKLGQQNAAADRRRIVEKGTYAFGLVLAFQPDTVGPLLSDAAGGTPQRFLWFSAHSAVIGDEVVAWPGPVMNLPFMLPDTDMRLPQEAMDALRADRIARRQPGAAPTGMDGHAPLHLVKLAALLAILDHRHEITMDDWVMAGTLYRTSRAVREQLVARLAEAERSAARAADERKVAVAAASAVRSDEEVERTAVERLAALVAKRVHGGVSQLSGRGGLRWGVTGRDRPFLSRALELAAEQGLIVVDGDGLRPGR